MWSGLGLGTAKAISVRPPSSQAQLGKVSGSDTPHLSCATPVGVTGSHSHWAPTHFPGQTALIAPFTGPASGKGESPVGASVQGHGGGAAISFLGFWFSLCFGRVNRPPAFPTEVESHCPQDPAPLHLRDTLDSHGGARKGQAWETGTQFPSRGRSPQWVTELGTLQESWGSALCSREH